MAINIDGNGPPNSPPSPLSRHERGGSTDELTPMSVVLAPQTAAEIAARRNCGEERWKLRQCIRFVSREIFATARLRDYQMLALEGCLDPKYSESKMLLVTRTGFSSLINMLWNGKTE